MARIVVTGTSSGIGQHIAQVLSDAGHQVCGLSRRPSEGLWKQCDVNNQDQLLKVKNEIQHLWGSIEGLICCAGIQGEIGAAMESDPVQWCRTVRSNVEGTFLTIHSFFPLLSVNRPITDASKSWEVTGTAGSPKKKVVCFSGGGSTSPRPYFSAYGVAKTAVVRLVETLATEWQGLGIDIYAVAPGAIATEMTNEVVRLGPAKVGKKEYESAVQLLENKNSEEKFQKIDRLIQFLFSEGSENLSGKLISAPWDDWVTAAKLTKSASDLWTLRRIVEK